MLRELALDDARTRCHATYLPPPQVFDHLLNMFFFLLIFHFYLILKPSPTEQTAMLPLIVIKRVRESGKPAPFQLPRLPHLRLAARAAGEGRRLPEAAQQEAAGTKDEQTKKRALNAFPSLPQLHDHQS